MTNTDVCHIANMRKDENIAFTLVNPEKKDIKTSRFHIYGFRKSVKLHVSQICYDYQISENVHFHAVKVSIRKYIS